MEKLFARHDQAGNQNVPVSSVIVNLDLHEMILSVFCTSPHVLSCLVPSSCQVQRVQNGPSVSISNVLGIISGESL